MNKTILPMQYFPRHLSRSLAFAAIMIILALSIGGALAERMEQRAVEDRLSFGDVATCVRGACADFAAIGLN
jgi:hypothetical protein